MTESDRPKFNKLLTDLGELLVRDVDLDLADGYFTAMKQFEMPTVERAFKQALLNCEWFPKPVELRGMCIEPERYVDDYDRTYKCARCLDKGIVLTDRVDHGGNPLGTFACPCSCEAGDRKRDAWEKPDAHGHVVSDVAKSNTEKLRKLGALRGGGFVPRANEDDEYGKLVVAAMKRITEIGTSKWLTEEIEKPSSDDPRWCKLVVQIASDVKAREA